MFSDYIVVSNKPVNGYNPFMCMCVCLRVFCVRVCTLNTKIILIIRSGARNYSQYAINGGALNKKRVPVIIEMRRS